MKYLLLAVLAGFFIINPAIADEDDSSDNSSIRKRRNRDSEQGERKNRRFGRKSPGQWEILKHISKEEAARLRKLHASDPTAWKVEVKKVVERIKAEKKEQNKKNKTARKKQGQEIKKLVSQYKTAKDADTKKEYLEQLHKLTKKVFSEKMKINKQRLESLEKRVKSLRKQYEFRKKNADKIIQSRVNTLTNDTKFDW